jgi:hypothetical protein
MNNGTENNLAKKIKFVKGMGSFGEKMVMAVLSANSPRSAYFIKYTQNRFGYNNFYKICGFYIYRSIYLGSASAPVSLK